MNAKQLTEDAWACIESAEMSKLASLFSPDAEVTTSAGGGRGRAYVTQMFTRHRQGYPDLTHQILSLIESADGDAVALRLEFHATHLGALRGPYGVIEPTGCPLVWRSSDQVYARDGQIVSWHAQFDRLTILEQLGGSMPAPAGSAPAGPPTKESLDSPTPQGAITP